MFDIRGSVSYPVTSIVVCGRKWHFMSEDTYQCQATLLLRCDQSIYSWIDLQTTFVTHSLRVCLQYCNSKKSPRSALGRGLIHRITIAMMDMAALHKDFQSSWVMLNEFDHSHHAPARIKLQDSAINDKPSLPSTDTTQQCGFLLIVVQGEALV